MNDSRVFVLLGKKLSNEATEAELNELSQLLQDKSIQPYLLELLQEVWQKKPDADEELLEEKWESVSKKLEDEEDIPFGRLMPSAQTGTGIFSRWAFAVAACISGIVLFSVWFIIFRDDKSRGSINTVASVEQRDSVIVALNGERKKITLPDSTKVHLNSGSRLVYKKDFGKADRQVWLTGEAFFEVTKDKKHPFLVNTNHMLVKVLGTVFNVKAYDTKEDIETTVVEGRVEVSMKDNEEKKVVLLPGEKVSLKNNKTDINDSAVRADTEIKYAVQTVKPAKKETVMPSEAVWVNEKMTFTDEPFEIVALEMERWYNVHFHFEKEKMKDKLVNGDFEKVNIEEALQVLQYLAKFKYEIKGNEIYIK
jgi:transmembrane sensor